MRSMFLYAILLFLPSTQALGQDLASFDNRINERLAKVRVPGLVVAVVGADGKITERAYGVRSIETGDPVVVGTLFHIGSIAKTFTAAALLKAMEEKNLSIESPIGSFVKGLRPELARLSVHHLLSHTAGLSDRGSSLGLVDESALALSITNPSQYNAIFAEPGKVMSYSNPGFQLAGYVLQEVTGRPFADAMYALLLKPLGAERTFFRPTIAMTYPIALGHTIGEGLPKLVRPMPFSAESMPSGHVFASAENVARLAGMILAGGKAPDGSQVLSTAVIDKMTTAHAPMDESAGTISYGYGLFVEGTSSNHVWNHGGGLDGFNSAMTMRPDKRIAVVVLANAGAGALVEEIKSMIINELAPPAPSTKPANNKPAKPAVAKALQPVPAKLAAALIGKWGQGEYVFTIRKDAQNLTYMVGSTVLGTLHSEGGDRLVLLSPAGARDGYVAVVRDANGQPAYLAWGGRAVSRLPAEAVK